MDQKTQIVLTQLKSLKSEFEKSASLEGGAYDAFGTLADKAIASLEAGSNQRGVEWLQRLDSLCYEPAHTRAVKEMLRALS